MFIFVYFFTQTDPTRTVQRSALCRSRRELSNAYFLAKCGFDTAENEPCKVCPLYVYRSPRWLTTRGGVADDISIMVAWF